LILNEEDLGFSAGISVLLAAASGELPVMLNNDTYATQARVRTLHSHLRSDTALRLIGPVTNSVGNETKIPIACDDMVGMIGERQGYTRGHCGERLPVREGAFFCVAMRHHVVERVGSRDEVFGVGFFEGGDCCWRAVFEKSKALYEERREAWVPHD